MEKTSAFQEGVVAPKTSVERSKTSNTCFHCRKWLVRVPICFSQSWWRCQFASRQPGRVSHTLKVGHCLCSYWGMSAFGYITDCPVAYPLIIAARASTSTRSLGYSPALWLSPMSSFGLTMGPDRIPLVIQSSSGSSFTKALCAF